ncbi:hypothetical protein NE686_17150 [Tissierella carlieri]|uniref:Uncharacterized protein n=1 Tax=Tissierella carlieri TaxID=689904 RepID=A0ABT1SEN4_9FIRM|nr:hypothetical protein [Tissierella carlieri]MCQ4924832.1 hypothetical protein [Tissierella carlieri]
MSKKKRKVYKKGDNIPLRCRQDASDALLKWINSRGRLGAEIFYVLEMYANNKLVSIDYMLEILNKQNSNLPKSQLFQNLEDIKKLENTTVSDQTHIISTALDTDDVNANTMETETNNSVNNENNVEDDVELNISETKEEYIFTNTMAPNISEDVKMVDKNKENNNGNNQNKQRRKVLLSGTPTIAGEGERKPKNLFAEND